MIPEVDYRKIGQRIRSLRIEKGITQADLSELMNCSNNHLSHIETGSTKVSLNMLLKIGHLLNKSPDYFLLDTPYARPESIIDAEISRKLKQCSSTTLVTVHKMLDILIDLQNNLGGK